MQSAEFGCKLNQGNSYLKPHLIYYDKQTSAQSASKFLKTFPKYFARAVFDYKSLQKNSLSAKVKLVKRIDSFILVESKPFKFHKHTFLKSLMKNILHNHNHSVKRFIRRKLHNNNCSTEDQPSYFVRHIPAGDSFCLDTSSWTSKRNFSFLDKLRELKLMVEIPINIITGKKILTWRVLNQLAILRKLEIFKLQYDIRKEYIQHFYQLLYELEQIGHLMKSVNFFVLNIRGNPEEEGLPLFIHESKNIFDYTTHIKLESHSNLIISTISRFHNLISLETDLFPRNNNIQENCTAKFFSDLGQLKNLKYFTLRVNPKNAYSNPGQARPQVQEFLRNFTFPESVENMTLVLQWFKLYEIIPCPKNQELYLLENNLLQGHELCQNFSERWRNHPRLSSFYINIMNGWDQGYVLNRYLALLILSNISRLENLTYCQASYGGTASAMAPLDFGLFLKNIQHLWQDLKNIKVKDIGIATKQSFEGMQINAPKLQKFKLKERIVRGDSFMNLCKAIAQNTQKTKFVLDAIVVENQDSFQTLLDSVLNIPRNIKVSLCVNGLYLTPTRLSEQLCAFMDKAKHKASLSLAITHTKRFSPIALQTINQKLLTSAVFQRFRLTHKQDDNLAIFDTRAGIYPEIVSEEFIHNRDDHVHFLDRTFKDLLSYVKIYR